MYIYIHILSLRTLLYFSRLYFSRCISVHIHNCKFLYLHTFLFLFFYTYCFNLSIIFVGDSVLLYM